jgi:hypothetical protein
MGISQEEKSGRHASDYLLALMRVV